MSRMQNLYTGGAGQAAVMSEFLFRGYNVAVPEVDRGDDLFVVQDADGSLSRIQVKAVIGKRRARSDAYAAQVVVPLRQLSVNRLRERGVAIGLTVFLDELKARAASAY